MKYSRQAVILDIIDKNVVETQEELTEKLRESGFKVTQATVSRDIKELQLVKVSDESGISKYSVMKEADVALQGKMLSVYTHAFLSADYANNIVIVKTLSGMGQVCRTEKYAEEIVKVLIGLVE